MSVRIVPTASNGFNIELLEWQGTKGDVVVGILECHTDGKSLYILRREKNFTKFKVIDDSSTLEKPKLLAEIHSMEIKV